jgi:hypothetical protein
VKDDDGSLYFATTDTETAALLATAVSGEYVRQLLDRTLSRRVVVLLDCCYSGAFTRGTRGDPDVHVLERFQQHDGRGRAVITASSATEYAWEGDDIKGEGLPSVFTSAVVNGLETGEADRDGDGHISVDDLYDYVLEKVRDATPNQTPNKQIQLEGELIIAESVRGSRIPKRTLAPELLEAIHNRLAGVREGVVADLAALAQGGDPGMARAAEAAIEELANDDSHRVSAAAQKALADLFEQTNARSPVVTNPARSPRPGVPADLQDTATADPIAGGVRQGAARPLTSMIDLRTSRTVTDSLPGVVVGCGWIVSWLVSLALAWNVAANLVGLVVCVVVGWCVTAPFVAAVLSAVARRVPFRRTVLIAVGWPVCIAVGLGIPLALLMSASGAVVLGLAVAAGGLLGALALAQTNQPIAWGRVLLATIGWCAGWLSTGMTAWPQAFWRLANGEGDSYVPNPFAYVIQTDLWQQLALGAVLSGIVGGAFMIVLLRPSSSES